MPSFKRYVKSVFKSKLKSRIATYKGVDSVVDKTSIQHIESSLKSKGLKLPTDYVFMKKSFKKELIKYYLKSLGEGQLILDLNPGLDGIYNELKELSVEYLCLEQNPNVRKFLENKNIPAKNWRIPEIPLENNSVNYVLSAPFIEHLPTYLDALNFLLEVKRILKPDGKILLIVPNYLCLKEIFFEDYKHSWVTTKKRLIDMLLDCQYEVLGFRYTIGWITMKMNPLTGLLRLIIYITLSFLRFNLVERLFETLRIHKFGYKVKKTLFELIVIEAQVSTGKGEQ